jgi:hypothetical protein
MATTMVDGGSGGQGSVVSRGTTRRMALTFMFTPFLLLVTYLIPNQAFVVAHFSVALGAPTLGIWTAVWLLGYWKPENNNPPPSPAPWMLGPLLVALVVVVIGGARAYIHVFYQNDFSSDSLIDGLNYAIQTVTTVGYGNWPFHASQYSDAQLREMNLYSLGTMIAGASLFTMIIGMITTWLQGMKSRNG